VTTPYRNELEALSDRRDQLAREADRLRAETHELDQLRSRQAAVLAELAEVDRMLAGRRASRTALPMLERVRVASPCDADWNAMKGDERVRFCSGCEKNVYNLSAMPREEAEALLQERVGNLCVRFYQRKDGTVLTEDCPVGVKRKRRRLAVLSVAGAGAMAAAAVSAFGGRSSHTQGKMEVTPPCELGSHLMGDVEPVATPVIMGTAAPVANPPVTPPLPVKPPQATPPVKPPPVRMGRPAFPR